jgi:ABC-type multidrug transport system fused ATPase/permease subunit
MRFGRSHLMPMINGWPVAIAIKQFGFGMCKSARVCGFCQDIRAAFLRSTMQQAIDLIGLIQSFGREATESRRFAGAVERSVMNAMRLNWQENLYPLAV